MVGGAWLAGTWIALARPEVQRADVWLGERVRGREHRHLERAVTATTDLGSVYGVVGTATALALARRREAALDVAAVGAAGWVLAQTNKRLVRRERPYEADAVRRLIRPPTGSSFPSGHATVATAVSVLLADRARPGTVRALLAGTGSYVGLTRVYVGVHYPSDVIGGAGLGLLLAGLWRGRVAELGRTPTSGAVRAVVRVLGRSRPLMRD